MSSTYKIQIPYQMKESTAMVRVPLFFTLVVLTFPSLLFLHVHGDYPQVGLISHRLRHDPELKLQEFKASLLRPDSVGHIPRLGLSTPLVYELTSYGADPTGKNDSTNAILSAMSDALKGPSHGSLMAGMTNLGGAKISLQGGIYLVSRPLRFPTAGVGNLVIHGGTFLASDTFPKDGYLIDLSSSNSTSSYNYDFITLRDLFLDANYRGGGIRVPNSLRTSIDNCYIAHFMSNGIWVQGGHETYIRNSFLGQHVTAGGDPKERTFTGTAIYLQGNDNAVTDVVIFSASVGIMVTGQANTFSGVHCYNKATGFGGTGIYLRLPGYTQTRIVNCYMDYTGIVAEDPAQLDITNSFFLGDAYILLKSIKGVANGLNIVNNMFSGSNKGVNTVQLDQSKGPFKQVKQVVVDRNNVVGMNSRSTIARKSMQGNMSSWTLDFSSLLLFPNSMRHVQYSLSTSGVGSFPKHVLRNVSQDKVTIESDVVVSATVFVTVEQ